MINIVGYGQVKDVYAFDSVKNVLDPQFDIELYLAAFLCKPMKQEVKNKVIYNMEYLRDENPLFQFGYMETLKDNIVIDFSRSNVDYLKSKGIDAFYMPYGFCDSMKKVKPKNKDIDVLFIGSMHFDRRQKIMKELNSYCKAVVAVGVYGEELDELIARSKVHINMHHAEGQPLETVRINYLLANNCTVVSELGSDQELNQKYQDNVLFCKYDELVDVCLSSIGKKIDSGDLINKLRHDSSNAQKWAKEKLCLQ